MVLTNVIRTLLLYQAVISLISFNVSGAEFLKHSEFTVKDYVHSLRGHQLNYEFFRFITNLNKSSVIETNIDVDYVAEEDNQCLSELLYVAESIINGDIWALRMIDAWGNIPTGLLYGNLFGMGNYDECIRLKKEISPDYHIKGKYCTVLIPVGELLSVDDRGAFSSAVCMPSGCNTNTFDKLFQQFLNNTFNIEFHPRIPVLTERLCSVQEKKPLSGVAITAIVMLSILTGIGLLCTIADYFYESAYGRPLHPVFNAFSIRNNLYQTFRIIDYSKNPNVIVCLNGIRCLSLIWVIFAHDFMSLLAAPNLNFIDLYNWFQTPFSMLLTQGFFSVDSFFFLTALLVTVIFLREMDSNNGELPILLMYLHRVVRLLPTIGFAILIHMSFAYFSDGPFYNILVEREYSTCKKGWWATLLFIQNYYNSRNVCVGQTWYLGADTQLYVLSPILLIGFYKWGKKAVAGALIVMMLLWTYLFTLMMTHEEYSWFFKYFWRYRPSGPKIYFPTHVHTSPYIIGMVFGYYLHLTRGKRIKVPIYGVLLGWITCFGLIATTLFSLYPKGQMSAAPLTTLEGALFVSLSRIAWPLALCWIVFACVNGYGGPIQSFLGHDLWQPLARISFSMYAYHFVFIEINTARVRANTYFSSYDMMLRFWYDCGFTIVFSICMYVIIEAPIGNAANCILPGRHRDKIFQQYEAQIQSKSSKTAAN